MVIMGPGTALPPGEPGRHEVALELREVAPAVLAAAATDGLRAGYRHLRLVGTPAWRVDGAAAVRIELERLAAVRWACGGEGAMSLDLAGSVAGADLEMAVASLGQAGLRSLVRPLHAEAGLAAWIELAAWSPVPIVAEVEAGEAAAYRAAGVGVRLSGADLTPSGLSAAYEVR